MVKNNDNIVLGFALVILSAAVTGFLAEIMAALALWR